MDSTLIVKVINLLEKSLTQEDPKDWIGTALSLLKGLAPLTKAEELDKGLADNRLKIEVWEARHAVVCWWNETPIKRGTIDLDGLEDTMVRIIKSHSKIRDTQKPGDTI